MFLRHRSRSPACPGRRWAPRWHAPRLTHAKVNEGLQSTRRRCQSAPRAARRPSPPRPRAALPRECWIFPPPPPWAEQRGPLHHQSLLLPRKLNVPRVPLQIFKLRPGLRASANGDHTAQTPASQRLRKAPLGSAVEGLTRAAAGLQGPTLRGCIQRERRIGIWPVRLTRPAHLKNLPLGARWGARLSRAPLAWMTLIPRTPPRPAHRFNHCRLLRSSLPPLPYARYFPTP